MAHERDIVVFGTKYKRPMGPDSISKPYAWHMAQDGMLNHKVLNKFGMNDDVGAAFETVWDGNIAYPWQTGAALLSVTGGVEDDPDKGGAVPGTGAWTINVSGLDANYNEQNEDITLNGAAPVASVNTYIRVFRARVLTAGSTGTNVAAINIAQGGVNRAIIQAGYGQTLMALWTVPAGYDARLAMFYANTGVTAKPNETRIRIREFGGAWNTKRTIHINGSGGEYTWTFPLLIPAKSDIEIQSKATAGGGDCAAGFDLWYEPQ